MPLAFCLLQREVFQRDVLIFVDNEAAVSALIRGASRVADAAQLTELFHALLLRLAARAWVEWVDSDSNPADGLSRRGLQDPWTIRQDFILRHVDATAFPPVDVDVLYWMDACLHWAS